MHLHIKGESHNQLTQHMHTWRVVEQTYKTIGDLLIHIKDCQNCGPIPHYFQYVVFVAIALLLDYSELLLPVR